MKEWALLIILGIPAAVILTPLVLRSWERRRILDAVMAASNAGQSVPAPLIEGLIAGNRDRKPQMQRHERDHRRGVVLIAICVSFAAAGVVLYAILGVSQVEDPAAPALALGGVGLFPGIIGAAYALLAKQTRSGG